MLIAVCIALVLWVVAIVYGFNLGLERMRRLGRMEIGRVTLSTVFLVPAALLWLAALVLRSLQLQPETDFPWSARMAQRLEAGFFFALGIFCLVSGLVLMLAVLPVREVFALIFGFGFIAGAFAALRRHRRWRQWLISNNQAALARWWFYHLLAWPAMLAMGCLILAYGL